MFNTNGHEFGDNGHGSTDPAGDNGWSRWITVPLFIILGISVVVISTPVALGAWHFVNGEAVGVTWETAFAMGMNDFGLILECPTHLREWFEFIGRPTTGYVATDAEVALVCHQ